MILAQLAQRVNPDNRAIAVLPVLLLLFPARRVTKVNGAQKDLPLLSQGRKVPRVTRVILARKARRVTQALVVQPLMPRSIPVLLPGPGLTHPLGWFQIIGSRRLLPVTPR